MRRILLPLALAAAFSAGMAQAQTFSSLEERMTESEFRAAGLDKLSEEELAALPGEFRGWSRKGEAITLANGQVWEIVDSASRLRVNLTDPQVVITQGALGAWYLRVEGYNTRVNVRRIK